MKSVRFMLFIFVLGICYFKYHILWVFMNNFFWLVLQNTVVLHIVNVPVAVGKIVPKYSETLDFWPTVMATRQD